MKQVNKHSKKKVNKQSKYFLNMTLILFIKAIITLIFISHKINEIIRDICILIEIIKENSINNPIPNQDQLDRIIDNIEHQKSAKHKERKPKKRIKIIRSKVHIKHVSKQL